MRKPFKLSPHQIVMKIMALREKQRADMVKLAIAVAVKDMSPKDRKKWFKDNGSD